EKVTGQRIELATVPTVADLRARRLELLRSSVHEVLIAGELDSFRGVVESLSAEFGALDVAAAAMKLLHQQKQEGDADAEEQDIPTSAPAPERGERRTGNMRVGEYPGKGPRRPERGTRPDGDGDRAGPSRARKGPPEANLVKLFIGAGRKVGMRPADLVGAIAGEAGLPSSRIGAIQIADGYSLVEVPEDAADTVVTALKAATLRGKRVPVRRERG
ncbi:MAG TPA: DbpA RNA binding domain-containing protein, partial [Aggregicoccus sp.]|nr:DbpA RNA binding domain-containing protein [Aggregicoccus sp.]